MDEEISSNKRIRNELVMTMCKRERPEMIFKPSMGLLEDVDVRVADLNNTANHLTIKHLEHEQTHQKKRLSRNDVTIEYWKSDSCADLERTETHCLEERLMERRAFLLREEVDASG